MILSQAKSLAPNLIVVPYEFEEYTKCSNILYNILLENANFVQAVSCDEAFIDVTFTVLEKLKSFSEIGESHGDYENSEDTSHILSTKERISSQIAEHLRQRIYKETGCNASVGISHNILLACLATKLAKPNGSRYCNFFT